MTEHSLMAGLCRAQLLADPVGSFESMCAVIKPHLGSIYQSALEVAASVPNNNTGFVKRGTEHAKTRALWEDPIRGITPSTHTTFQVGSWPCFELSLYGKKLQCSQTVWHGSFTLWGLNRHGLHLATIGFIQLEPTTLPSHRFVHTFELARVTHSELLELRSLESLVSNLLRWLEQWKKQREILEAQAVKLNHDLCSIREALQSAD